MSQPVKIAIIGARGHVGYTLLGLLLKQREKFSLTYITSRHYAGKKVSDVFDDLSCEIRFRDPDPAELVLQDVDIIVLGLPNGLSAPYVQALDKANHSAKIIDLSSDHRHVDGWSYGLVDVFAHTLAPSRKIANPGCYATAASLALYPLRDLLTGSPSIFGVSGYSGAGTEPNEKNDPDRLAASILPYGFNNHSHQEEISQTIGYPVRFMPHVASFFRGLMTTISAPIRSDVNVPSLYDRLQTAYADSKTIHIQHTPPEIRDVVDTPNVIMGGIEICKNSGCLAITSVHDNLLKGAAWQCLENIILATKQS